MKIIKPSIPPAPTGDAARAHFDRAVKERLEIIGGERAGRISALTSSATLSDVIAKINELINRIQ